MDPVFNGSKLCLVRDELVFDPGLGYQRVVQWRGAQTEVTAKGEELAAGGWRTRISYSGEGVSLEATSPEITDDGSGGTTISGAVDQWDFTTEIYDASLWASPMLHKWMMAVTGLNQAPARARLITWKSTVDQNLKWKYVLTPGTPPKYEILKDVDGTTKLPGPTSLANFNPVDDNNIPIVGSEKLLLSDLYEWVSAGQTSVLTSLVSIQRRRQVPVESTLRFTPKIVQNV
jgi:hypothetical protein